MNLESSVLRETSHPEKANTAGPHLYVEPGLNTHSSKCRDAPNLSALSDLDLLHKPEMKRRTVSRLAECQRCAPASSEPTRRGWEACWFLMKLQTRAVCDRINKHSVATCKEKIHAIPNLFQKSLNRQRQGERERRGEEIWSPVSPRYTCIF